LQMAPKCSLLPSLWKRTATPWEFAD